MVVVLTAVVLKNSVVLAGRAFEQPELGSISMRLGLLEHWEPALESNGWELQVPHCLCLQDYSDHFQQHSASFEALQLQMPTARGRVVICLVA